MSAEKTPEQIQALADAMWQILDDMGTSGHSVCGAAKAKARVAFEPWVEPEDEMDMPLEAAEAILRECGLL